MHKMKWVMPEVSAAQPGEQYKYVLLVCALGLLLTLWPQGKKGRRQQTA